MCGQNEKRPRPGNEDAEAARKLLTDKKPSMEAMLDTVITGRHRCGSFTLARHEMPSEAEVVAEQEACRPYALSRDTAPCRKTR